MNIKKTRAAPYLCDENRWLKQITSPDKKICLDGNQNYLFKVNFLLIFKNSAFSPECLPNMVTLVSMLGFSNDLLETNFSTSWVKVASTILKDNTITIWDRVPSEKKKKLLLVWISDIPGPLWIPTMMLNEPLWLNKVLVLHVQSHWNTLIVTVFQMKNYS